MIEPKKFVRDPDELKRALNTALNRNYGGSPPEVHVFVDVRIIHRDLWWAVYVYGRPANHESAEDPFLSKVKKITDLVCDLTDWMIAPPEFAMRHLKTGELFQQVWIPIPPNRTRDDYMKLVRPSVYEEYNRNQNGHS